MTKKSSQGKRTTAGVRTGVVLAGFALALLAAGCSAPAPAPAPETSQGAPSEQAPQAIAAPTAIPAPSLDGVILGSWQSTGGIMGLKGLQAKDNGVAVALACQGDGDITVALEGYSAFTMQCVAAKETSTLNHDLSVRGSFGWKVTASPGVAWGLAIANLDPSETPPAG